MDGGRRGGGQVLHSELVRDRCVKGIPLVKRNRGNGKKLQHCEWILDGRAGVYHPE
ncbi:hypothetical protein T12_2867 [Trichinella patagoniensis]|uniref:Uncharacterized protein n=1 Tax=Trichinella patagoniensis TaxID=990121 RepID=A0A0V1A1L2_9BILA|nr:hypothetical protein T12_8496 [Trichinella patagoniensis]KRY18350.1 hypothetical protein T12_2867 [Trichinella patagoniensis]